MRFNIVFLLYCCLSTTSSNRDCDKVKRDVIFLLDCSTSIQESSPSNQPTKNWLLLKKFLIEVFQLLPISTSQTRSTVLTFSTSVHTNNNQDFMFENKDALINHVSNLPFLGGNTNTSGALRHARKMLYGSTSQKRSIVLITDGMSNVDAHLTLQEARLNKQRGITQYAVGVGMFVDEDELQDLVTAPASYHYLHATDFSNIYLLVDQILDKLTCWKPPLSEPCKDSRADIMFLLDASGSIEANNNAKLPLSNWFFMKKFFTDLTKKLNVASSATRIGLIKFSHIAMLEFYMDEYTDVDKLVDRISSVDIIGSETNTSGALRLMNDQAFQPQHGDRPDVHNVAIVMTDGQSNVNVSGTVPEAKRAKELGVRMFVIGLTENVNSDELRAMSSHPIDQHYFTRSSYSLVQSVVSNLVWNVCQGTCTKDSCSQKRCQSQTLSWRSEKASLIVGHDYSRLSDITSPADCQNICLQDPLCRSVEFIPAYQECSVSYYRRSDVPLSFKSDPEVTYYEWVCN